MLTHLLSIFPLISSLHFPSNFASLSLSTSHLFSNPIIKKDIIIFVKEAKKENQKMRDLKNRFIGEKSFSLILTSGKWEYFAQRIVYAVMRAGDKVRVCMRDGGKERGERRRRWIKREIYPKTFIPPHWTTNLPLLCARLHFWKSPTFYDNRTQKTPRVFVSLYFLLSLSISHFYTHAHTLAFLSTGAHTFFICGCF